MTAIDMVAKENADYSPKAVAMSGFGPLVRLAGSAERPVCAQTGCAVGFEIRRRRKTIANLKILPCCRREPVLGIHDLRFFVFSGLLLNITPGPDTAYIVGRSLQMGRRRGDRRSSKTSPKKSPCAW
jgi:hypothetical protein